MQKPVAPAPSKPRNLVPRSLCPSLDRGDYAELVWSMARCTFGRGDAADELRLRSSPSAIRTLSGDRWVQRYLECAERSFAGRPLSGGELGVWLRRQRHAHAAGVLPSGRTELLERLDGFTWAPDADRWSSTFDRVEEFAGKHGYIPARGDNPALARWLANQRLALRRGRLDRSRAEALDTLPGWRESLSNVRAPGRWEQMLSLLADFYSEHGFYPDRRSADKAEADLGQWAHQQRGHHHRGDLSTRRIEALEKLPDWRWNTRDATFDRLIHALREEMRRGPVSRDHSLYRWAESQRRRHRDGRLSEEQSAALESLGLLTTKLPDSLSAA